MSGCCSGARRVIVEIDYLEVDGATCERCSGSISAASKAVSEAQDELAAVGVVVELTERRLDRSRIADSNRVLVNGRPAEEWVSGRSELTECPSCSELLDADSCCRAFEIQGEAFNSVPVDVVAKAIRIAAGLESAPTPMVRTSTEKTPSPLHVTLVTSSCG